MSATQRQTQRLPPDRKSVAIRLGAASLIFTCGITYGTLDGTYGTMLLIPAGGEMSEAAVLPIFLESRIIALHPVWSGTVKPPLFKPLRERGAHGRSACLIARK